MIITVCDGCGKNYKPYVSTPENGSGNAMTIVTRSKQKKIEPVIKLDLCPDCMNKVWDFIHDSLITEQSLRYSEFFETEDETAASDAEEPVPMKTVPEPDTPIE